MQNKKTVWDYIGKNFFSLLSVLLGTITLALSQLGVLPSSAIGATTLAIVILLATSQLVDTSRKLESIQKSIDDGFKLGELLEKDKELHSSIQEIAKSYLALKDNEFELFSQRSRDVLAECKVVLNGLERGYMLVEPGGKYAYGTKGVTSAKKTVKAVAYEDIDYWRTVHLQSTVQVNSQAIKRGVEIQRVFIVSNDKLEQAKDVLDKHVAAGVKVFVVSPDELSSPQLLESYLIIDDKILVVFYYTREGRLMKEERISIESVEVNSALSRFSLVIRRARPYINENLQDKNAG
jgi:hypothetical protein